MSLHFREPAAFTSKVKIQFMYEGMELWTSFASPRWLNIELLSYGDAKLDDLPPVFILAKAKGLGCLSLPSTCEIQKT